jgi:hypothetical protein
MSINSKNYQLVMGATLAIVSTILAATVKADPNPYLQSDSSSTEANTTTTKKNSIVKPQQKIQSVNGKNRLQESKEGVYFGEGPRLFVKSGKPAEIDRKVLPQSGSKSLPSAVDVEKKVKSFTSN